APEVGGAGRTSRGGPLGCEASPLITSTRNGPRTLPASRSTGTASPDPRFSILTRASVIWPGYGVVCWPATSAEAVATQAPRQNAAAVFQVMSPPPPVRRRRPAEAGDPTAPSLEPRGPTPVS